MPSFVQPGKCTHPSSPCPGVLGRLERFGAGLVAHGILRLGHGQTEDQGAPARETWQVGAEEGRSLPLSTAFECESGLPGTRGQGQESCQRDRSLNGAVLFGRGTGLMLLSY